MCEGVQSRKSSWYLVLVDSSYVEIQVWGRRYFNFIIEVRNLVFYVKKLI